jgi:hypothetical protein
MAEVDVLVVLFDSRLSQMPSLSNVHLSTLAGGAVLAWHFDGCLNPILFLHFLALSL